MASLKLENVTKRFGRVEAIKQLDLDIRDGEFFCVLGPPGAGKTTTLRLIVGLERPDEGTIYIDGKPVNDVHPGRRDIAMVFQNLALYPDKTVFDNIAYPLRERKIPKQEIERRVTEVARKLYIDHLLKRKPAKLSGGERQRVAIGRAIIRQPRAYLMDEPLANLDALLRLEMRVELKRLQGELGQTLVYVTHDQVEAMSMADRIAVLDRGLLQQCDVPDVIYNLPNNHFVAKVVGSPPMNFIPSQVSREDDSLVIGHPAFTLRAVGGRHPLWDALERAGRLFDQVLVGVRPEDVQVYTTSPGPEAIPAQVSVVEPLGAETILDLRLEPDLIKSVMPPTQRLEERRFVWLTLETARVHIFDAASGIRLYSTSQAEGLECQGQVMA
ncbi:MAG: sn-glycerol-3-phosphate ABC transporter ATP-binding protein UgpC [Anaerolineae bacterium]